MPPVALITGINGQDGKYLTELLLSKGYTVHGTVRRSSVPREKHLYRLLSMLSNPCLILHTGDITDPVFVGSLVTRYRPDEIYNLGALSHVQVSFDNPVYAMQVNALSTLYLLESIRAAGLTDTTRFYQASTSEIIGDQPLGVAQNEATVFNPASPYSIAKVCSHYFVKLYRQCYGMFAVSGILFNHESPYRGQDFITKKITTGVAAIAKGTLDKLTLGNVHSYRDWGHSKDFVKAMYLMLHTSKPKDYCIGTGETHSVKECTEVAFAVIGKVLTWHKDDAGMDYATDQNGQVVVQCSREFFRPAEVPFLLADASKAKEELGWQPTVTFRDLIHEMMQHDLEVAV